MKTKPVTSYKEAWEEIHGPDGFAEKAKIWFAKNFPNGHDESLRPFVERMLAEIKRRYPELRDYAQAETPKVRDACEFHPRALELLIERGGDYTPDIKKVQWFHDWEKKPLLGQCFTNSWLLMDAVNSNPDDDRKIVYVEGMVWGFFTKPVLHAWNSYGLDDTRAIDWSHYVSCEWSRYLGIAFTEAEHLALREHMFPGEPQRPISIFDIKFYPFLEEKVHELLAAREAPATSL